MRKPADVVDWVQQHPLQPVHVDCATAVMLKILDGKCKMNIDEKRIMRWLYQAVKQQPGVLLGEDMHRLIAANSSVKVGATVGARKGALDDVAREMIYEARVLAESRISRPVMKAFKAMIRHQGLFSDCYATA